MHPLLIVLLLALLPPTLEHVEIAPYRRAVKRDQWMRERINLYGRRRHVALLSDAIEVILIQSIVIK